MTFSLREATLEDQAILEGLIAESARGLSRQDYTDEQIEAALHGAMGVDTQLIRDGTYFVVEAEGEIVACGGWSRRKTLFGADSHAARQSELLDPAHDAARIRAFFVRPAWARQGIGRALLERCEAEARAAGFRSAELMATLPGWRLYKAMGYEGETRIAYDLGGGITIEFVPMRKEWECGVGRSGGVDGVRDHAPCVGRGIRGDECRGTRRAV
ncbi:MAG TPA: GNAT family N-acetyltransferase [Lacipirellulaceae bacterium]|nr:GNAT family N-acetyltransferase [Lacipirellulaceae bacterium]